LVAAVANFDLGAAGGDVVGVADGFVAGDADAGVVCDADAVVVGVAAAVLAGDATAGVAGDDDARASTVAGADVDAGDGRWDARASWSCGGALAAAASNTSTTT
jgi:hypothetical protein